MTHRISYRRHLTGAMTVAALMVSAPMASAQPKQPAQTKQSAEPGQPTEPAQPPSKVRAGIEEAVQALDTAKSAKVRKLSPQAKKELIEFAIGNTLFVMAHEMGHVLVNELGLPVLGKEEDAADSFATLLALQLRSTFSERVLIEAAKGWVLSSRRDKKQKNPLAFYDEHGLDLQRAYNVVCFMVGSDPEKYKALAAETKLPEERQKSCVRDYKGALWSWDLALKPHRRTAEQPKITINVDYKVDEDFEVHAKVLRNMGLLEAFAENAANRFTFSQPFSMEARSCGEPNATWTFGTRTLTLCYELVNEFMELHLDYGKTLSKKRRTAR